MCGWCSAFYSDSMVPSNFSNILAMLAYLWTAALRASSLHGFTERFWGTTTTHKLEHDKSLIRGPTRICKPSKYQEWVLGNRLHLIYDCRLECDWECASNQQFVHNTTMGWNYWMISCLKHFFLIFLCALIPFLGVWTMTIIRRRRNLLFRRSLHSLNSI